MFRAVELFGTISLISRRRKVRLFSSQRTFWKRTAYYNCNPGDKHQENLAEGAKSGRNILEFDGEWLKRLERRTRHEHIEVLPNISLPPCYSGNGDKGYTKLLDRTSFYDNKCYYSYQLSAAFSFICSY